MLYGYGIGFLGYFTSSLTVPAFRLRDLLTLGVITVFSSLSDFILYLSFAILSPRSLCLSSSRLTSASFGIPKPVFSISHLYSLIPCLRHLSPVFSCSLLPLLTPLLPSFAIPFLDLSYLCLLISLFSSCYPQLLFVLLLYLCLLSRVLSLVARCRLPVLFCFYVLFPFLFSIPCVRTFNLFDFSHYPLRLLAIPCCTLILARVHDFTAVRSWCLCWCLSLADA